MEIGEIFYIVLVVWIFINRRIWKFIIETCFSKKYEKKNDFKILENPFIMTGKMYYFEIEPINKHGTWLIKK